MTRNPTLVPDRYQSGSGLLSGLDNVKIQKVFTCMIFLGIIAILQFKGLKGGTQYIVSGFVFRIRIIDCTPSESFDILKRKIPLIYLIMAGFKEYANTIALKWGDITNSAYICIFLVIYN